jgi:hypothetical protein
MVLRKSLQYATKRETARAGDSLGQAAGRPGTVTADSFTAFPPKPGVASGRVERGQAGESGFDKVAAWIRRRP